MHDPTQSLDVFAHEVAHPFLVAEEPFAELLFVIAVFPARKGCMQFDHACNLINFTRNICVHTYTRREFAYYVVCESLYPLIRTSECIQWQFDSGMQHQQIIKKYVQIVIIHQNYGSNSMPFFRYDWPNVRLTVSVRTSTQNRCAGWQPRTRACA